MNGSKHANQIKYTKHEINNITKGCDFIFNLIEFYETKDSNFRYVHTEIPKMIAESADK